MLNVLIVDDEPLALDVLETYISQMSELNLVKRCSNALEANEVLKTEQIDLLFLDIQMPQLTGIDFVKNPFTSSDDYFYHSISKLCDSGL
ncbi:MAG: response regulator [Saprospiraceae bacterium]